ncbi:MAG: hypothetical protein ACTTHM_10290 [Peptoanaerobacter stomatis]|uniref:hypothetical protein n=1 Tax=Peptoanaerobacter stomatis TaxID=796937 RepID=UPI003F9ED3C6
MPDSSIGYVYFSYLLNESYSESAIIREIEKASNEFKKATVQYASYMGSIDGTDVVLLVNKEDEYNISQGENIAYYKFTGEMQELVNSAGFKSKAPIVQIIKAYSDEVDYEYEIEHYAALLESERYMFYYSLVNMGIEAIEGFEQ